MSIINNHIDSYTIWRIMHIHSAYHTINEERMNTV
nr:MAG TPA: hypothetical protein [Bacteriophage sp.]